MKRILLFMSAVALCCSMWAADTFVDGIWWVYAPATKQAWVSHPGEDELDYVQNHKDEMYKGEVVVPEKVTINGDEYTVVGIGDWAFFKCKVTKVTLPKTLKTIGDYAFAECTRLEDVIIPDGVTTIGKSAFNHCNEFFEMVLPNSVTRMGDMVFYQCTNMLYITLSNQLETIPGMAFAECALVEIEIPSSVTYIDKSAFNNCYFLESISLPRVREVGYGAFAYCLSLERVTLGAGVRSLEEDAFCGCSKLKEILIYADRLIEIDEKTFSEIDKLDDIIVYVPADLMSDYASDEYWKKFHLQVLEASAIGSLDEAVSVVASTSSVNIAWQVVPNAERYVITLKEKSSGKLICTVTFNKEGYLMSINYNKAPARLPQARQESGFAFEITDLDPDMEYEYTLVAHDELDAVLDTQSGSFSTKQVPTGIDSQKSKVESRKLLREGKVYIVVGEKSYDASGRQVK